MRNQLFALFTSSFLLLLAGSFNLSAQVLINEWSAANFTDQADNFGENEDWIELYNTGAAAVDLSGYHLSDRLDNPTKWAFPAGTSINGGDVLLVWCSGKDVVAGTNFHTNFKITQTKATETVVFADALGNLIDSFPITITNQTNDSWARIADGDGTWGVDESPTPGASNGTVIGPYSTQPTMTPDAGWYVGSVMVELSTPDPMTTIYYTTNGDIPTIGDNMYTGPFNVTNTTVVRARAFSTDANKPASLIETNTYFLDPPHTVRVISIAGDQVDNLLEGNTALEPVGSLEYFDETGTLKDEAVGEFNEHGNDSNAYDQRGFDYVTRDEFGYNHAIQEPIFDLKDRPKFQRLILKAGASDNYPFENGGAHIRDAFVHTLSHLADMKMDERTYEPCVVYLNGEYWGVYEIREKVDDHDFTRYYYDQGKEDIDFLKRWGGVWADYGTFAEWNAMENYILTNDMTVQANLDYVDGQYNILSLIDYTILNTFIVNSDWLNWNTAWWRGYNPDGDKKKWRFALWDLDASFDHYANFSGVPDESPNADPCFNESPGVMAADEDNHMAILAALMENEEVAALYVNRFADLNNTFFTCEFMIDLLDELVGAIEPEMQRHCNKWGGTVNGWMSNVQNIRDFIDARCTIIDTGIEDCYEVEGPFLMNIGEGTPGGTASIQLNTIEIETFPWSGDYFEGAPVELTATPMDGFVFDYWEINQGGTVSIDTLETTSFNITVTTNVIVYYVPIGMPYVLDVIPAGAGEVNVEGVLESVFPLTFYAQAGDTIDLIAIAGTDAAFIDWEFNFEVPEPNYTSEVIYFIAAVDDSITANFNIEYQYSVESNITGAGQLFVNGAEVTPVPWTGTAAAGATVDLEAVAAAGYYFVEWQLTDIDGPTDLTTTDIATTVNSGGTMTAIFAELPLITINGDLIDGGTVSIDGTAVVGEYSEYAAIGDLLDLVADPAVGYEFVGWQTQNGSLITDPFALQTELTVSGAETITAVFQVLPTIMVVVDPAEGGSLIVDGNSIPGNFEDFVSVGQVVNVEAIPATGFQFVGWTSINGSTIADASAASTSVTAIGMDVIAAVFELMTYEIEITVVGPAGEVNVDGTSVTTSYTTTFEHGQLVNLEALVPDDFVFVGWTGTDFSPAANSTTASFVVNGPLSISAEFSEVLPVCRLYYPSAFAPNGQSNKTFSPIILDCEIVTYSMTIFNRYGQKVFWSPDPAVAWDGTFEGKDDAPMGVYMYVIRGTYIDAEDGELKPLEGEGRDGSVTLLR